MGLCFPDSLGLISPEVWALCYPEVATVGRVRLWASRTAMTRCRAMAIWIAWEEASEGSVVEYSELDLGLRHWYCTAVMVSPGEEWGVGEWFWVREWGGRYLPWQICTSSGRSSGFLDLEIIGLKLFRIPN